MKNIRIITTLGPSSISEEIVKKMDLSGADIFRINLSHTNPDEFEKLVESVRKWTNKPIAIDTEGAQLRTSKLPTPEGIQFFNTHDIVTFVGYNSKCYEFGIKSDFNPFVCDVWPRVLRGNNCYFILYFLFISVLFVLSSQVFQVFSSD